MIRFAVLGIATSLISMLIRYAFPELPDSDDSNPVTVPTLLQLLLWLIAAFVVAARSNSKREVLENSAVVFVASVLVGLPLVDRSTISHEISPLLLLPPILLLGYVVFTAPALLIFFLLGPPSRDSEPAA
jgi:hypothetical protein